MSMHAGKRGGNGGGSGGHGGDGGAGGGGGGGCGAWLGGNGKVPQKRWATPSWHCGAHNGGNASGVSKWPKRVLRAGHRFYAAARAWMKECALGSVHTSVGAPLVPGASPSKQ